jgi:hypothetical protein
MCRCSNRLRAEYLYKIKKTDDIKFHFTSGHLLSWNDYKNGTRAFVNGNSVSFRKTAVMMILIRISGIIWTLSLIMQELFHLIRKQLLFKKADLKTGDILLPEVRDM